MGRSAVAEGVGFEPTRELNTPYPLSRRAHSATMRSLRLAKASIAEGQTREGTKAHGTIQRLDRRHEPGLPYRATRPEELPEG